MSGRFGMNMAITMVMMMTMMMIGGRKSDRGPKVDSALVGATDDPLQITARGGGDRRDMVLVYPVLGLLNVPYTKKNRS